MATGDRIDPYASFNFLVEIEGVVVGGFSEVSGLQAETETEEYREGGVNDFVYKLPKITKYPNLTLKRGVTDLDEFWKWHQDVVAGDIKRKNGSIILTDSSKTKGKRWNFTKAYPVKWVGPDMKADSNTVAVESLEIAHRGLTKLEKW